MAQPFNHNGRWMTLDMLQKLKAAEQKEEAPKSFCDQCDSKGVRHKKECPNAK